MKQWTNEERTIATRMRIEGKSYADISRALNNKTYNQVRYYFKSRESVNKSKKIEWNDYKKYGAKPYMKHGGLPMQQQQQKKSSTKDKIIKTMDEIKDFLVQKNLQYGDSVFQPVRVFSKADKTEQIKVRIDDKLSRLKRGNDSIESDEDVVSDLIGYLVILLISMRE
mgnify:CR=1 FL=1